MPLLDDRGRVFGRINAIDLIAALATIGFIALGSAAWIRVHTPRPLIEGVTASSISAGEADRRVAVRGRHLRPFLRANIGGVRTALLFESTDRALVRVPPLPAGAYDLAVFDAWKEIARFPKAVTVHPGTLLDVLVRFVTRPEIVEHLRRSQPGVSAAGAPPDPAASGPVLLSFDVTGGVSRFSVVQGRVRVRATWTADGWQADGVAIRAGAPFTLTAPTYVLEGEILTVGVAHAAP